QVDLDALNKYTSWRIEGAAIWRARPARGAGRRAAAGRPGPPRGIRRLPEPCLRRRKADTREHDWRKEPPRRGGRQARRGWDAAESVSSVPSPRQPPPNMARPRRFGTEAAHSGRNASADGVGLGRILPPRQEPAWIRRIR